MKRSAVVVAIVCCLAVWPRPAQGATGSRASAHQSANLLLLPSSTFSPATVTYTGVYNTADLDKDTSHWPRSLHSTDYATFGRVTGYYVNSKWQPPGSSDTIEFGYSGSIFSAEIGAERAWKDGSTYFLKYSNFSTSPCPSAVDTQCTRLVQAAVPAQNIPPAWDDFMQYGQCLLETDAYGTPPAGTQDQVIQTLATIDLAAVAAAKVACSPSSPTATPVPTQVPVTFQIISVRLEKNHAQPDWKQVTPPLRSIQRGKTAFLSVYWRLTSAPPNPRVTYTLIITRNGKAVVNKDYTDTRTNYTPDTWRYPFTYAPARAGRYTVRARITVDGQAQESARTRFTVLPRPTPRPPPPPPAVSITFDRLQVTDAGNHAKATFRVREDVRITVVYTVRNLPAGQFVTGTVARSIQIPEHGRFRVAVQDGDDVVAAGNGTFTKSHDTGGFTVPGAYRILVGLTFRGRPTQVKQVDIQVR